MQIAVPAAAAAVLLVKHLRNGSERRKRLETALDEFREVFNVKVPQLHALRDELVEQMEAGLANKGGLMMLPSYVDVLPSGHESGDCFAIDLGGTNLRVAHLRLGQGRGEVEAVNICEWPVPEEHFDVDRGSLLRFVAARTAEVVRRHAGEAPPGGQLRPVIGFCFSFPVEQTALDNGRVLVWTKNFRGRHLVGHDVVAALRVELAAAGLPGAVLPAVMNDTVATLVALRYSEPATQLGIILGTGTNCAYVERAGEVGRLAPGYAPRTPHMVVNTEWGDLGCAALPACQEDLWVDCSSAHPGSALFEKRVSGLYLGEVARRVLLRLAEKEALFGGAVPGLLARHHCFTTAHMAAADEDDSPGLEGVAAVLREALRIERSSQQQRSVVQEVCRLVSLRSARLCAAAIAGVLQRMGHPAGGGAGSGIASPPRVVVAVDGSVFAKYAKYRERLGEALQEVCGEAAAAVELRLAQDGGVLGAALLAAAATAFDAQRPPDS